MKKQFYLLAAALLMSVVACNSDTASTENQEKKTGTDTTAVAETKAVEYKNNAEVVQDAACQVPKTMRDLTSGVKDFFYYVNSSNEGTLSLFGMASVTLGKKEQMVIIDFSQFKDLKCEEKPIRYGVGARLFLHIKKIKRGVNLAKLPDVAAEVQSGRAVVTYSIETVGITGEKILDILPDAGDFNVEAYNEVINAVNNIRRLTKDNEAGVVITPQIIPLTSDMALK